MSLLADTFYLGANAKVQAIRFALCLALGLASGIIALLYLRKARPVERALTDFFATVCIGGLFIVCMEFFLDGKFELYGLAAFVLGIVPIPLITRKLLMRKHPSQASPDGKQAVDREKHPSHPSHPSGDENTTDNAHPSGDRKQTASDENNISRHSDDDDKPYDFESVAYEKPEDYNALK